MEFFYKKFPLKKFKLRPLGDIHYGSQQCQIDFFLEQIETIKEEHDTYWVGMGDLMENAIVGSKSDVYKQEVPPEEQAKYIASALKPIKHKGLFFIGGNHEYRSHRATGMVPEEYISAELGRDPDTGIRWVPYMGYSCLAVFQLMESKNPQSFKCYFHHNYGGGYTKGGKINRAEKLRDIVPTADATFSGHFHSTARIPSTWFDAGRKGIIQKIGYDYITGSALEYNNSYAEEHAKPPAVCEFIAVDFIGCTNGRQDNRQQIYHVITNNGGR